MTISCFTEHWLWLVVLALKIYVAHPQCVLNLSSSCHSSDGYLGIWCITLSMAVVLTSSMGEYGERHTETFTTDRRGTNRTKYSTQVQLGEPMSLLGLLIGSGMIQRQHQKVLLGPLFISYIAVIGISGRRGPCDDLVSLLLPSVWKCWARSHEDLMHVIIAAQFQVYDDHVQPRRNGYTISSMNSKLVFTHNLCSLLYILVMTSSFH